MAIVNGYATLAEARAVLDFASTDTSWDTVIENYVEAVSRVIDLHCGRRFHTTANDETRYFRATSARYVETGDLISVTTLQTDDNGDRTYDWTWTASHYDLVPVNAALDGRPYTGIAVAPEAARFFPVTSDPKAIKVVGKFGYAATPEAVNAACLLAVAQTFNRKSAIYGVSGGAGLVHHIYHMLASDPMFTGMLAPYVRGTARI